MPSETSLILAKFVFLALIEANPGLSEPQLRSACCESMYMDYLSYAQIRQEMQNKQLAQATQDPQDSHRDVEGNPLIRWKLTQAGAEILPTLRATMPDQVLRYLSQLNSPTIQTIRGVPSAQPSVATDRYAFYERVSEERVRLTLQLLDQEGLNLRFDLPLPSCERAEAIGRIWLGETGDNYAQHLQALVHDLTQQAGEDTLSPN